MLLTTWAMAYCNDRSSPLCASSRLKKGKRFVPEETQNTATNSAISRKILNEAQVDCRKRRRPDQRNSRSIHCSDGEKDNRRQTQDRRDDRYEICVDLESAEKTPNDLALQKPGDDQSGGEKPDEADQSKDRYVMTADVK